MKAGTNDKRPSIRPNRQPGHETKAQPAAAAKGWQAGFTLIELLVVISIIALLMGILLPVLSMARSSALASNSLSNIRQMGIGLAAYNVDNSEFYPKHSSPSSGPWPGFANRPRWADYLFDYMQITEIYRSPLLSERQLVDFAKPFAHDTSQKHGGYGYNFQYLGNSRFNPTFHARNGTGVLVPSNTVTIGDTAGSRDGDASGEPGANGAAVYVLDPPLASARGAHPNGRPYYEGGNEEPTGTPDTFVWRSFPAERNNGAANIGFADGHADAMRLDEVDDFNGDGVKDNGYWNGLGNAAEL